MSLLSVWDFFNVATSNLITSTASIYFLSLPLSSQLALVQTALKLGWTTTTLLYRMGRWMVSRHASSIHDTDVVMLLAEMDPDEDACVITASV